MKVHENLRQIRILHSVKQEEIADLLCINQSNYSRVESGLRILRVDEIQKIADYLNEDVTYFFTFPKKIEGNELTYPSCPNCAEKDKTIKTLNEYIEVLKKEK